MKTFVQKKSLYNFMKRNFSVLPKAVKMEVSMRTPYKTFFNNYNGFLRFYIGTGKGQMCVGNRTFPAIYLLPAGEIKFIGLSKGEGNFCEDGCSGEFVHSGGYCMIHEDNTADISLMECIEKEKFGFDKIDSTGQSETAVDHYDKEASQYAVRKVMRRT
mmetsp:Transcript_6685/g.6936  ORF Transcript_6685/g.6936 Transcript_6685/m.6936 type:complete len:159 (+) Transcript_6685:22-498(+)